MKHLEVSRAARPI